MRKLFLLFAFIFTMGSINAQKRNMFPVYSFDITGENIIGNGNNGHLFTREVFDGGNINVTIDSDGIDGNSLKVEVLSLPNGKTRWDNAIKYFVEVDADDVLEIRFKAKADRETSFHFETWTALGSGNGMLEDRKVDVTTEVKEYIFRTDASTGNTIQRLTFQFGSNDTEEGSVLYFDDLSIIKINTDWDGNLIRNGKFEIADLKYSFIEYKNPVEQHTLEFDNTNALDYGQSIKINNTHTEDDWRGSLKSYYLGNGLNYKVSFHAKNGEQTGSGNSKIAIGATWDLSGGCFLYPQYNEPFAWQKALNTDVQFMEYTFTEDISKGSNNNHFMYLFGWYSTGTFWIDNLKVEQIGLQSIDIVEWDRTDSSVQLWINATPSSANNKVTWSIDEENSDGEGTIDAEGLLTVTKAGTINVKAISTLKPDVVSEKAITFTSTPTSVIDNQNSKNKIIYTQYYSLTGVLLGKVKPQHDGIYIAKDIHENGGVSIKKILVK